VDLNLGQGASTGGLSYKGLQLYHNYKTDATDKSLKNSNHGVMYTGRSLYFDGSNDYVELDGTHESSNNFTIALWVRFNSQGYMGCITTYSQANKDGFVLRRHNTRYINFFGGNGTGQTTELVSDNIVEDNQWVRLVVSVDSDAIVSLYIDNELQTNTIDISSMALPSDNYILGDSYTDLAYRLNGELSNVQIWDKAWTADDVEYDYNNPNATPNDIANNNSALSVAN